MQRCLSSLTTGTTLLSPVLAGSGIRVATTTSSVHPSIMDYYWSNFDYYLSPTFQLSSPHSEQRVCRLEFNYNFIRRFVLQISCAVQLIWKEYINLLINWNNGEPRRNYIPIGPDAGTKNKTLKRTSNEGRLININNKLKLVIWVYKTHVGRTGS